MAMSGVTLAPEVAPALKELRLKRHRYVIMSLSDDSTHIVVREIGDREKTFDAFVERVSTDKPCYAAFDFEFEDGGQMHDKLILVQWIPETCKTRVKMMYSASRDALSSAAEGYLAVQANDTDELEREEILRKIKTSRFA